MPEPSYYSLPAFYDPRTQHFLAYVVETRSGKSYALALDMSERRANEKAAEITAALNERNQPDER
ncbi:hypothetical protein [Chelatococcus asaccharovorans]|uniref:Uncharacterized protein n=1 Tax=Chelatococcus asaccharovorans TaxID=28210 RepID=A0A2V3UBX1_9HYPH|nr:hypothetical protein [Chelatococcus asaccharovorans]MBS7703286.1 hypothetical protein [Chelatococcus asaccharovorans]PXW61618.1 hypothetical protein C7450_103135 [Chelatococcus asaccharovorans]